MCDLVGKVFPHLVEAVKMIRSVPKEIEKMDEEHERIQILVNCEDRMAGAAGQDNQDENGMKRKVRHMREAALRIEEVTEDYMITEQQQSLHDPGCAAVLYATTDFIKTMISRLRISYEIQDIKSTIVGIEERSERSGLQNQSTSSSDTWHSLREESWCIKEDMIVGFESRIEQLKGWMLGKEEKSSKLAVICVVGMGGLGKTTLAKTAYDKVIGDFDCSAYIIVSPVYNIEDLLRKILNKMCERTNETPPENISHMDRRTLIDKVHNYLKNKRYVIFFDDVWNHEFWSEIRLAVDVNNKKSRILITTRKMEVANFCNESPILYIHNMQPLSDKQSLELFYKKALKNRSNDKDFLEEVKEISLEIVGKCEGLPLAIVAVGGLLCTKKYFFEWQVVYETLVSELDSNPHSTGITNILGLSYNDLPHYLKPCLLYFGIYPKKYEVGPKRLIRQWIAEGFVKPINRSSQTLDKVGEQYLKELVDKNLVQVSSFSIDDKPKKCRVHDLLRDMILTKIEDIEFCHFASNAIDDQSMPSWKIRRLQIATESNVHLKGSKIECSLIRSFYTVRRAKLPMDLMNIIPPQCKRLKIFHFEDNRLKYIPGNFGCLIRLRYLSFRNTNVRSIPESIGNLQNLETLDLRGTHVRTLPREINKLRKLEHLLYRHKISWNCGVQMMGFFSGLKSIHTLHKVETSHSGEDLTKVLEQFMQLRCLGLVNVKPEYINPLYSSIIKMKYLEKLCIGVSEDEGSIDLDCISPLPMLQKLSLIGRLERVSQWIARVENIVKLTLCDSNLTEDPLNVLSSLPKLVSLSLSSAYRGETLHFQNGGFQKLKRLVLKSLSSLNSIHINEGALPLLKELVLKHIPELSKIPSGINHLDKLEVFDIIGMSEEFKACVQENDLGKKMIIVKLTH